ncbi:hypothetical protein HPB47_001984, partial [Ixodes persulcatus]
TSYTSSTTTSLRTAITAPATVTPKVLSCLTKLSASGFFTALLGSWKTFMVGSTPSRKMPEKTLRSSSVSPSRQPSSTPSPSSSACSTRTCTTKGSSKAMRQRHAQMDLLFKGSFIRGRTMRLSIVDVTSLGGKRFLSVAKRANLEVDIYSSILTGQIKDDLVVQSWRNGAGDKLPNDCNSNYTVTDVDSVKLNLDQSRFIAFNTTEDHSKWAIAVDKSTFCLGSMNRMESQFKRGGEALCFENSLVNRLFKRSAIVNTGCPVRR